MDAFDVEERAKKWERYRNNVLAGHGKATAAGITF